MDKVRFGIIGIGKMGSLHCLRFTHGLIKNGVLTAVCDISPERKAWAEKHLASKGVEFFDDYKTLIDSGKADAVLVATPHYDHPVIATYALSKGLHTLIEKPAGVYTKAIRELNEFAATKPELTFGIMYNQRTNKLYRFAKELVETGRLGEMKRINWIITNWYRPQAYYDQGGWRGTWAGEGGGVLINQCPHQLDLFQWLGGMPSMIRGYAKVGRNRDINVENEGRNRDINVENDVTAYMEYPNGATGVFITSTHDFPGTNRLEIDGDKGKIVIENNKLVFTELEVAGRTDDERIRSAHRYNQQFHQSHNRRRTAYRSRRGRYQRTYDIQRDTSFELDGRSGGASHRRGQIHRRARETQSRRKRIKQKEGAITAGLAPRAVCAKEQYEDRMV